MTTSVAAFAEDRHSFVERPLTHAPWRSAAIEDDVLEHTPEAAFEPLNLGDEQGLSAFRSRLFAPASDEQSQIDQTGPVGRAPISVPRKRTEEPQRHVVSRRIAPDTLLSNREDATYEPEVDPSFDVRALVAQQGELLDMTITVSPDVPRKCSTCRNYRASEQGERGWCTNDMAFTHRQMVNADDLACQSTIGCWWLPADEQVWLDGDIQPSHVPTPRIDRLVAHLDPIRRVAER
jgi:hypothetical protein